MNNCYELVQAQPSAPPAISSPPAFIEWTAVLAMIASGIGFLGREIVKQWNTKEQSESELMKSLVTSLQAQVGQLLDDSRQGQRQLFDQIAIKESMVQMSTLLKDDVGRALGSQGAMYARGLENQVRMEGKLDASLRQGDEIRELLRQILELLKNENSK